MYTKQAIKYKRFVYITAIKCDNLSNWYLNYFTTICFNWQYWRVLFYWVTTILKDLSLIKTRESLFSVSYFFYIIDKYFYWNANMFFLEQSQTVFDTLYPFLAGWPNTDVFVNKVNWHLKITCGYTPISCDNHIRMALCGFIGIDSFIPHVLGSRGSFRRPQLRSQSNFCVGVTNVKK